MAFCLGNTIESLAIKPSRAEPGCEELWGFSDHRILQELPEPERNKWDLLQTIGFLRVLMELYAALWIIKQPLQDYEVTFNLGIIIIIESFCY